MGNIAFDNTKIPWVALKRLKVEVEIWKDVKGFEDMYQISSLNNVRSLDRKVKTVSGIERTVKGKIIQPRINNCGYVEVRLSKGNYTKTCFVHRLVAEAFIPNPANKPQVNHLDGIKTNNNIENLAWVDPSENIIHAYETGLLDKNRGKNHHQAQLLMALDTGEIFYTIKEAATKAGINYHTFRNSLNTNSNVKYAKLSS